MFKHSLSPGTCAFCLSSCHDEQQGKPVRLEFGWTLRLGKDRIECLPFGENSHHGVPSFCFQLHQSVSLLSFARGPP